MVVYHRLSRSDGTYRYTRNNIFVKSDRIPPEVLLKFEYTDSVKFEDEPEKKRCLFCDAPATRKRLVTQVIVELCEGHYYSKNIGTIVAQLRELTNLKEKTDGIDTHPRKRKAKRVKRTVRKTST